MAKKLTDDALVAMLSEGVRNSTGAMDSKLSKERSTIQQYYDGDLPKPMHSGNSKYISMDVYDGVESMAAQLLDVFSGNAEPVVFAPQGPDDVQKAREATDYTNYVVFRQNDGYGVLRDVIQDGLKFRAGIVKVWWESLEDEDTFVLSNTTYEALVEYLMKNPDATPVKVEWESDTGSAIKRVDLTVKRDKSQIRIKNMPPEEFFISGQAVSMSDADLVGHRYRATMSQLVKQGYSKKLLDDLGEDERFWLDAAEETFLRHDGTSDLISPESQTYGMDAKKTIEVFECYTELDLEGDGKSCLYQVIYAGNKVLRKEKATRKPFLAFVPLPKSHAFYGTNFASLLVAVQNARTALTRSIIDHALITNNPRYAVVQGGLTNPKELMDNRIGGIVNIRRPDAVFPLPQSGLNPFVFQTIAQVDADKEQRIGISRLSQGLNGDAISKQNSADMVAQMVSMSQVRQKVVARNFAEDFLANLFREVYRLVAENETAERVIQIAGSFQTIDPTSWPERDDLVVKFALGYGEQEKEAMKYVNADKLLSSDPRLARMYPENVRFQVIERAMKGFGLTDVALVDPSTLPPPEPSPMEMAELKVKEADAAVKMANAEAAKLKVQLDLQKEQNRHAEVMAKLAQHGQIATVKEDLDRDKLAHTVTVDAFEMALQQQALADGKLTAQADPTN